MSAACACSRSSRRPARGAVGVRDSRRLARHLAHCQPCRREALEAGLDRGLLVRRPAPERAARRIAALLPFPAFLRLRREVSGAAASSADPVSRAALHLPALSEQPWGRDRGGRRDPARRRRHGRRRPSLQRGSFGERVQAGGGRAGGAQVTELARGFGHGHRRVRHRARSELEERRCSGGGAPPLQRFFVVSRPRKPRRGTRLRACHVARRRVSGVHAGAVLERLASLAGLQRCRPRTSRSRAPRRIRTRPAVAGAGRPAPARPRSRAPATPASRSAPPSSRRRRPRSRPSTTPPTPSTRPSTTRPARRSRPRRT